MQGRPGRRGSLPRATNQALRASQAAQRQHTDYGSFDSHR